MVESSETPQVSEPFAAFCFGVVYGMLVAAGIVFVALKLGWA